jgi:hypothetical protein
MKLSPVLFILALAGASGAVAAAPADKGTPVTEVVVPGGPPPKMTGSYPAENATIPAGTLALKVTFDEPMTPDDWSYAQTQGSAFPKCLGRPRLLADKRTFVLLCTVLPHQAYGLQINSPRVFANQSGRSANPTLLKFSTAEVGPRDIHDALQQAGLTDADDPVMTWRDSGAGVSRSTPPADTDDAPGR